MISVIVASANKKLLKSLYYNVAETIGVEHEIISFDNSKGERGLCELYNNGAQLAKYPFLCFMHEDIEINTFNWGTKMINLINASPNIGLLGVAGCTVRARYLSNWNCHWFNDKASHVNIHQRFKYSDTEEVFQYMNPKNEKISRVVSIDGVWMFTPKRIALELPFDHNTFGGFHCYDIDFSLNIAQKYHVYVTYDISIIHFSEGKYDLNWLKESRKLHKKWSKYLPMDLSGFSKSELLLLEKKTHRDLLLEYGDTLKWTDFIAIMKECRIFQLSISLYISMLKYILIYYLSPRKFIQKYGERR